MRIGAKTTAKLVLGITTMRELPAADPDRLVAEFGPMTGPWLALIGPGRGNAEAEAHAYVAPLARPSATPCGRPAWCGPAISAQHCHVRSWPLDQPASNAVLITEMALWARGCNDLYGALSAGYRIRNEG